MNNDQYNVLLIDRDINHLQQLFQFLELHRVYNVMSATSGEMAVLIAQKKQIDIIVLDWETAIAAGVDVLNELQSAEGYRPVVILASPTQYEKDKDFINTKAVEYLPKPVDKDQFLSTIRQVVQSDSPKPKYSSKEDELNAKAQQLETEIENFKQKKLQLEREVGALEEKKKSLEQKEQSLGTQEQNIKEQSKMIELEKVKVQESAQDVLAQQQELSKKEEELSHQKEVIELQSKEFEEKSQFEQDVKAQELAEFKHQSQQMTQMQKQTLAHFLPLSLRETYLQDQKSILQTRNEVMAVVLAVENIQALKSEHELEAIELMLQALGDTWQKLGEKYQLTPISSKEGALVMGNGILKQMPFHTENVLKMAWEMGEFAEDFRQRQEVIPDISLTINLGNLIIGKINQKFISYDFWGDLTEAMETGGKNQFPLISEGAYQILRDKIEAEKFGQTKSPQLGLIDLYWIKGMKSP